MSLGIYLITQTDNLGYDTYDAAVVCAPDAETAKRMHPRDGMIANWHDETWASKPEQVTAFRIGEAADECQQGLVLGSYNAG